jgi:hypothetical protein
MLAILVRFNKIWTPRQIVEKYSKTKFNKNPSSGSRAVSCGRTNTHGRTDRHDGADSRYLQFCEHALKWKVWTEGKT